MYVRTGRLLLSCCLILLASSAFAQTTAKTWQRWEVGISTAKNYNACNPSRDTELTVTYTSPSPGSVTYTGYGYWDGADPAIPGNTLFKLRASFPQAGTWNWSTTFSGGACGGDGALNTSGSVAVTASGAAQVAIYTQGAVKVNTSTSPARYFTHNSGLPFYWQGDTNWYFYKANQTDWSTYLDTRKTQGFTVIQVAMPTSGNGLQPTDYLGRNPFTVSGGCGQAIPNSCAKINPAFWQEYERKILEANNKGFVVVVIGFFKRVVDNGDTFPWAALTDSKIYSRHVVARLSGSQVVFAPGFDELPNKTQFCTDTLNDADPSCENTTAGPFNCGANPCPTGRVNMACRAVAIGKHIRNSTIRTLAGVPLYSLVTHHIGGGCKCNQVPCTADYWLQQFESQSWMNFQLFQSGQGANCPGGMAQVDCMALRARQRPLDLYNLNGKPVINGEGIYDQFGSPSALYSAYRARQVGYLSRLSGASGYTFGVAGTWDWGQITGALPSAGWGSASSAQMKHMCTLFRNIDWQKLVPQPLKIANQAAVESNKMVYAYDGTVGGARFAVAYLPDDSTKTFVEIDTAGLLSYSASWCLKWMNPTTGAFQNATGVQVPSTTRYQYTKPAASGDWVLLMRDTSFTCWTTPPKYCPCPTVSGGAFQCSLTP